MADSRTQERERRKERGEPLPIDLARGLAEAALSKKATELLILDLRNLTSVTDYFVLGTVTTDVHSRAVTDAVIEWSRTELDERPWHVEGNEGARTWVLLDYVDVVVHLFQPEARDYYSLDRLWGDAPREVVEDPPPGALEDEPPGPLEDRPPGSLEGQPTGPLDEHAAD
jgi:ribosome-associated protein